MKDGVHVSDDSMLPPWLWVRVIRAKDIVRLYEAEAGNPAYARTNRDMYEAACALLCTLKIGGREAAAEFCKSPAALPIVEKMRLTYGS